LVDCGQPFKIFVDYAHTDDALEAVLKALREFTPRKIYLVFGCGGERDRNKRAKMGRVATTLSDFTILTNDNPRSEDPERIIRDICRGIKGKNYTVILDRYEAIKKALFLAKRDDIVLIAGKGHEDYQILKEGPVAFNDQKVVRCLLSKRF
jgi:UDP-N-acetylmuramoyl-L-alanyl-D-glutamate--2,6-diaminopimelate ligase